MVAVFEAEDSESVGFGFAGLCAERPGVASALRVFRGALPLHVDSGGAAVLGVGVACVAAVRVIVAAAADFGVAEFADVDPGQWHALGGRIAVARGPGCAGLAVD